MSKKKVLWLCGGVLVVLLLVGLVSVAIASAQEPTDPTSTPEPGAPSGQPGGGRERGGFGGGFFGFFGGGPGNQWATFDAAAKALGLTPEALFSELHAGKTLGEIAEAQGVDIQAVQDAMNAARTEAMKQAIKQAVADGRMTQGQADWMLEGIEQGYAPMGRGFAPPMGGGPGHSSRGWSGGDFSDGE